MTESTYLSTEQVERLKTLAGDRFHDLGTGDSAMQAAYDFCNHVIDENTFGVVRFVSDSKLHWAAAPAPCIRFSWGKS